MLVVNTLSSSAASYYFRGQGPGRWMGQGPELLGLSGDVRRRDLVALLRGCHPHDGYFLPARKPARRRAGWDLILAAPKSVSLLSAVAEGGRSTIAAAHDAAVNDVVDDFERRLLKLRRSAAPGGLASSAGAVAAGFGHRANHAGEPHVHTHLLLCNLGRDDGGVWSSIDSSWWIGHRSLGAIYQLALRHHLAADGIDLDWRIRRDGLGDLADVPRAAIRSASSRSHAAAVEAAAVMAEHHGRRSGIRSEATVRTRNAAELQPWRQRANAAGFGPDEADRLLATARTVPSRAATPRTRPQEAALEQRVTTWLAAQRSIFRQGDVLLALAASVADGMDARQAQSWTEHFCSTAIPVPAPTTASPRWTTATARATDRRLVAISRAGRPAAVQPATVERTGVDRSTAGERGLSGAGQHAVRMVLSPGGWVQVLAAPPGRTNLLAQAAVLEAAGATWREAGVHVSMVTSSEQAAWRWRTLTGIESFNAGSRAEVVIVDHADRRPTEELLAVLAGVGAAGGRVILLEGGTSPRLSWIRSDGLAQIAAEAGRLDPGPPPVWAGSEGSGPRWGDKSPGRPTTKAADAAGQLLASWAALWPGSTPPRLVALGFAEVDALNQAARAALVDAGEIQGSALPCGGKMLQAGDRVVALRRLASGLPSGSDLRVTEVDERRSRIRVGGEAGRWTLDRPEAAHLGYGYAVTPALAARSPGPLLLLGPRHALGPHRDRVVAAAMSRPPEIALRRDPVDLAGRGRWGPTRSPTPDLGFEPG
jgi:conjugative relaxase-like TrwC/TraI family protein